MPKLATLIDDFQDGVIDASLWISEPGVTETGGRLKFTPSTSNPGIVSTSGRDLTDSQLVAHVPVVTSNGSTGTLQSVVAVIVDGDNQLIIRKLGSQLICTKVVAGTETELSFTPYSGVNHLFWRIRADASNIYWETSATGAGTFFVQHTESIAGIGFAVSDVFVFMYAGYSGVEAFPGTFQIEAVNPGLAFSSSGASTSTGSLDWITTAPGEFAASGASTSTGSLTFTLVLPGNVAFSATGASTSTGNLDLTLLSAGTLAFVSSATSTSTGDLTLAIATPVSESLSDEYYYFEPPIAYDLPPTLPNPRPRYINAHARWKGGQRRGRSVLKIAGEYTIIDTPTVDQIASADEVYQGGHVYTITAAIANGLVAAGFTVTSATILWTLYPGEDIYPATDQPPGYRELVLT
jgi:hypothetical protein